VIHFLELFLLQTHHPLWEDQFVGRFVEVIWDGLDGWSAYHRLDNKGLHSHRQAPNFKEHLLVDVPIYKDNILKLLHITHIQAIAGRLDSYASNFDHFIGHYY
jgi:hypothetical protein